MKVRQFAEGTEFAEVLLVRAAELRRRRDGSEYLRLELGDGTGTMSTVIREDIEEARELCVPGAPVHVTGSVSRHPRFGLELAVSALRAARSEEYDAEALRPGPVRSLAVMESDLRELIATVQDADCRRLLAVVFDETGSVWPQYRDAPAAKHYHQAYRHGLLEHSLSVAQAVGAIAATFPGVDRDVAVTAALLHDIGKLEVYAQEGDAISMTDAGRLCGEIPLGYYRVRRTIETLEGFPEPLARALLHIILSHHGSLEHGSPVVPCTREATLVHMIDNLGGKLGSFDRVERQLAPGQQWSGFDKAIGAGAYFGDAVPGRRRAA